ncbi:MAG: hypothetical protein JST42_21845 [Bacteroidetes bacterium]|nr:hypothetical protein [Bacteroidota bacterium]
MTLRYKHGYLITFLQCLVFFLFLYSGITKTMGFGLFVNGLDKSLFFDDFDTRIIGMLVIGAEFAIPVLLFFEATVLYGYLLSFVLLLLFTAYILLMFLLSPYLPCSCGGLIESLSWRQHVFFNVAFMGISLLLFFDKNKKKAVIS